MLHSCLARETRRAQNVRLQFKGWNSLVTLWSTGSIAGSKAPWEAQVLSQIVWAIAVYNGWAASKLHRLLIESGWTLSLSASLIPTVKGISRDVVNLTEKCRRCQLHTSATQSKHCRLGRSARKNMKRLCVSTQPKYPAGTWWPAWYFICLVLSSMTHTLSSVRGCSCHIQEFFLGAAEKPMARRVLLLRDDLSCEKTMNL